MTSQENTLIPIFGLRLGGIIYIERPGVYAIVENADKQIAVIETNNGYFLPGGGIDTGESAIDALEREIFEEIGYQISSLEEVGGAVEYIRANSDEKHYQIHSQFYKVKLGSKVGEGIEKDHRLVWLWPANAVKLLKRQGQAWAIQNMVNNP